MKKETDNTQIKANSKYEYIVKWHLEIVGCFSMASIHNTYFWDSMTMRELICVINLPSAGVKVISQAF